MNYWALNVERERGRVGLSLKRLYPDPWDTVETKYGVGEVVLGTVTNIVNFGAFVRIDPHVEGLVHVNSLDDDFYQLREEAYALVGERTGRRFRLGDPLRVQVAIVNRLERKIDFVLLPDGSPE